MLHLCAAIQLGPSVFFQQALAVAANRFRPPTAAAARGLGGRGGGGQLLHPRTQQLQDILRLNEKLRFALNVLKHPNPLEALKDPTQWAALFTGATDKQQQQQQQQQLAPEQQQLLQEFVEQHAAGGGKWLSTYALQLQLKLNEIVDNTRAEKPQAAPPGIRQWMERKAGAIRQRMQGKRVNYAARTVLAPDGLLAPNEVAVPLEFAMKLSVPEAVTAFNASQLSQMIRNGPNKHPGALALQDDKGNTFNLEFMSQSARAAKALELEAFAAAGTSDGSVFKVYRHLKDGDVVLMNRQPSLHRLSLMAHFVKVAKPMTREFHVNTFIEAAGLRRKDGSYRQVTQSLLKKRIQQQQQQEEGEQQPQAAAAAAAAAAKAEKEIAERVFRINFVNCSSYNADFDGDEMNLHVPQDAVARSEASQIVNADSQFTVPKNGDLVRGLIQDYCLAGALMTGRDTFLDVHSYQTLVYVGLERYLGSQGGGVRITLDRSKPLESSFAISSAAATCSSNLGNIVTVPPAVLWPKRLWTGKQVITTVLKTLVDGFARSRLRRCVAGSSSSKRVAEVLKGYRGINLESKSKTPGDAWGGAEDGDKEEACVIIRDSELLQGVFDKNQFGSSSGGLLHCVYLLLGGRAASMLLQCLSALFSCFLKMHGATTSPADFVLRTEGMQQREALIKKVVEAGTFLQEHFLWRLSSHLGCPPDEAHQRLQQRVAAAKATRTAPAAAATSAGGDAGAAGTGTEGGAAADWKAEAAAAAAAAFESGGGEAGLQRRKHALLKMAAAAAATATAAAGGSEDGSEPAAVDAAAAAGVLAEKLSLARLADAAAELLDGTQQQKQKQQQPQLNPWLLLRQKQLPLAASGIRPTAAAAAQQLRQLLQMLQRMQGMPQQRRELLLLLSSSPLLQEQLPRVAKLLQTQRLLPLHMQPSSCNSTSSKTEGANDCIYEQLKFPPPNVVVALPDGGSIEGSTRYLRPQLYHPSWLWQHQQQPQSAAAAFASGSFESPERYVLQSAAAAAAATATKQRVLLSPSIVTQERLRVLLQRQFKGRLSAFDELLDSFFMGFMGKVSSQSTDIMSGRSFLYRFPRNGFASMIKTGAKGSNVNYAMICVFLGQQSLEGRRVQPMSSGKSLPAFAPADFGSLARGFVLSSFLTGLREEEFYFHCMAGREGLIDTAVKTAKSGYLQRSLIKSLESLHLAYDGSVRDADGSILQFVYADDAMDPANANALKNMQLLTGNPYLLKWFNKPPPQVELSVHRNVSAYSRCKFGSKKEGQATEKDKEKDRDKQMERYLSAMEAQPFNSPLSAVGATNYLFEQNLKEVVASACEEYARTRRWLSFSSSKKQQQQEQQDYRAGLPAEELELLLRIAFHRGCMQPGEAVGVIAAQSIGEPATQMTLNTFHLAGHGAANVTMGIPRLRELLQLGAKTKTPQIIIPIKRGGDALGDRVKDRIALENAHAALRGFKTIRMEDFVHAVGVEANVYYQGPDSVNSFPEARPVGSRSAFSSRLYWEYEVSVQLEPLQHFCSVVRQFKPDDLLLLVLNKVIRPLLKKARKMAVASVSQYEFSEAAELQSDVQQLYRAFILKERLKSQWERRGAVKDILRSGNIACESGAGDAALEGEATSSKTQNTSAATNRGHAAATEEDTKAAEDHDEGGNNKQKQRRKKNEEQEEEEGSVNSADSGHEEDEDDDEEDEEQEEADEEDDDDERQQQQQQQGDSSASDTEGSSRGSEAEDDDDNNNVNSSTTEKKEKKEKGVKGVKREPSAEIEDPQPPEKRIKQEQQQQQQGGEERLLDLAEVLRGKRFDRTLGVFVEEEKPASESKDKSLLQADTYSRPQLAPSPFEPDAVWSSPAAFNKMAPLDLESAAILHDLKICRKTWRVVVKFGWPVDKCPYRIELLPLVKGLVEKVTLQQPQGVSNPRIVQGAGCTTGSPMELHCSGSNLQWLHRLKETAVDHNRLQTNDVLAVLKFYGIEAARALFLRELSAVFGAYGIQVHSAHLGLVADFVTRDGNIIPFNRLGIQNSNSPFLQMAFETSFKFLTEACERAAVDDLQSPSAALIVGSPATIGSQQSQLLAVLPDFTDS